MPRVALTLPWCDRVIGAQALRGVAEFLKIVGQNPRGDQDIHTRVVQILLFQAMALQHGQIETSQVAVYVVGTQNPLNPCQGSDQNDRNNGQRNGQFNDAVAFLLTKWRLVI